MILLVEGDGDRRALPLLLKRYGVPAPARVIDMRGKSNIVRRPRGFEDTIRREAAAGHRVFTVLVDGDAPCAPYDSLAEEQDSLRTRAQSLAVELAIVVEVHWAIIEFELWLIGGIHHDATYCTLQKVRQVPANTETQPVDPKAWLRSCLRDDYEPRIAECLAQRIDINAARQRNNSMHTFLQMTAALANRR